MIGKNVARFLPLSCAPSPLLIYDEDPPHPPDAFAPPFFFSSKVSETMTKVSFLTAGRSSRFFRDAFSVPTLFPAPEVRRKSPLLPPVLLDGASDLTPVLCFSSPSFLKL